MRSSARTLCLIPAKGGSLRLARKNVVSLGGRPLLDWAIDVARQSGLMDRIVVSTEDKSIMKLARNLGAEVPFMRPVNLSKDPAGVVDVALHALTALREQGDNFDTLIILLPTCPLRSVKDLKGAVELFNKKKGSFLMSVSRYEHTPFAAMALDENQLLKPFFLDYIGRKSQEMPIALRSNGAIYVLDVIAFEKTRSYYSQPLIGYEMPWERSIDIDTLYDLRVAESLLEVSVKHK